MPFTIRLSQISRTKRLLFVIVSCSIYFCVEITIGLKTGSLALIVDAFHQLNDLISYVVALVATRLTISSKKRPGFTFALKRCEIVGAFFNASILLALALSIFLQSVERFIHVPEVDDPFMVLVVGLVGVVLNSLCIMLCHDAHHGHSHGPLAPAAAKSSCNHDHHDPHHLEAEPHAHDHHRVHGPAHDRHHYHHHHVSELRTGRTVDDGFYYQSLDEDIRAVRIPSIVTQIARPISHMMQNHGHNATLHPYSHNHSEVPALRPQDNANRKSRYSRWRNTLFFQDEEARFGATAVQPSAIKHRSLDPGSPKYVMPDSQRWYDADGLPRAGVTAAIGGGGKTRDNTADDHAERGHGETIRREDQDCHQHWHSHSHDHHHHPDDHQHQSDNHHHDHHHAGAAGHGAHSHNLGFTGVLIHLLGDALNNIGVVIAAAVMWKSDSPSRFYADPAVSVAIGLIIFAGSLPLTISSARVLLEAAPKGLDLDKLQEELILIPGVASVHCLHVWQLTETDLICSLDVRSEARDLVVWSLVEKHIRRLLAVHGIMHVTISPEFVPSRSPSMALVGGTQGDVEGEKATCAALK